MVSGSGVLMVQITGSVTELHSEPASVVPLVAMSRAVAPENPLYSLDMLDDCRGLPKSCVKRIIMRGEANAGARSPLVAVV